METFEIVMMCLLPFLVCLQLFCFYLSCLDSVTGTLIIKHKILGNLVYCDTYKYYIKKHKLYVFSKSSNKSIEYVLNFNYILSLEFCPYSKK